MKPIFILFLISLTGCASNAPVPSKQGAGVEVRTIQKEYTPQVWSDHKVLKISAETCAEKGAKILESLGFNQIVKNGTYVYGNYASNRAAIKCVSINEGTFVYSVVAGPEVKFVEKLRNEIAWQL